MFNVTIISSSSSSSSDSISRLNLSQTNTTLTFVSAGNIESHIKASVKVLLLSAIIILATFGNILVILSVFRFERLRTVANWFIVSLALADLLVAVGVMPFNASQEILGFWLFGHVVCDVFNANDVLFSTASLLHLCCISMDRYIAITDPFGYSEKMTKRRVTLMLVCLWTASGLLSHVPIHMGWYTTVERLAAGTTDDKCSFEVNKIYVVISSTVSFWTPAAVMVFTYVKIFREAKKQERHIRVLRKASVVKEDSLTAIDDCHLIVVDKRFGAEAQRQRQQRRQERQRRKLSSHQRQRLQSDNKAAKTLGIIMGAFLFCWLPFFTYYVVSTMCEGFCGFVTPPTLVATLFWIGYFNSVLNPIIYAFYNRDFRRAFKTLLSCRRVNRNTRNNDPTNYSSAVQSSSAQMTSLSTMTRRQEDYADVTSSRCSHLGSSTMSFVLMDPNN